jgi:hypothetical protein
MPLILGHIVILPAPNTIAKAGQRQKLYLAVVALILVTLVSPDDEPLCVQIPEQEHIISQQARLIHYVAVPHQFVAMLDTNLQSPYIVLIKAYLSPAVNDVRFAEPTTPDSIP